MSIDHKAYLFRYDAFQAELAKLLYRALRTDKPDLLRDFINENLTELTDQGTEDPPDEDWEDNLEDANVQQYADLALTKYYDLTNPLGLGYGFDALAAYLRPVRPLAGHADVLICGNLFGPKGKRLDPGCMGTGLLSPEDVARFSKLLQRKTWPAIPEPQSPVFAECYYKPASEEEVERSRDQLVNLYRQGSKAKLGLLFVDFNDAGVGEL